ncbi:hypothetical protein [Mesorhizobium sp.]|uniref:hypothetical protein n=2 Tax=Mesorhizobium sp. TaxID=1871066 RepID=UPI00338FE3AE
MCCTYPGTGRRSMMPWKRRKSYLSGPNRRRLRPNGAGAPVLVFAAGVLIVAFNIMPPELAFGLVTLVLAGTGDLILRKGFAELNWPILIMLAAMIPLGSAVETTGAAVVMATGLVFVLPPESPMAIGVASAVGMAPQPLLIAIALGASIDFLTPIGHHNNTVFMGLACYRFIDFIRAGWPVTIAVSLCAVVSIFAFWV